MLCFPTDVDECQSRPCLNGATCRDQTNGYSCSPCPLTATGFNCERSTYPYTFMTIRLLAGGPNWRRAATFVGHAEKAVVWRQSFSFVLAPPTHGNISVIFARIWQILLPLIQRNFLCRIEWMKWTSGSENFGGLVFPICGCWHVVGWDPRRHPFRCIRFSSVPLVCRKFFPVDYVQYSGNSAVLSWFHARYLGIFQYSRLRYPHICEFATEIVEIHCISAWSRECIAHNCVVLTYI